MVKYRSSLVAAAATAALVALAGCGDRAVAPYPTSPAPTALVLGPGDTFEVVVASEESLSGTFQVAEDGTINYPLIGEVKVEGKAKKQVEQELTMRLADGFVRHPDVAVIVREISSKRVSVFGQVKTPGTFPYTPNMSIVEAITRAGGFTPMARKNSVRVTRQEGAQAERLLVAVEDIGQGKSPNFFLRPGDVVFVDQRVF